MIRFQLPLRQQPRCMEVAFRLIEMSKTKMSPSQGVPEHTDLLGACQVFGEKVGKVHVVRFHLLRVDRVLCIFQSFREANVGVGKVVPDLVPSIWSRGGFDEFYQNGRASFDLSTSQASETETELSVCGILVFRGGSTAAHVPAGTPLL